MALMQLEIQKQINRNEKRLEEIENELNSISTRSQDIKNEFKQASENNDVEKMESLDSEDDSLIEKRDRLTQEKDNLDELINVLRGNFEMVNQGKTTEVELKAENTEFDARTALNRYLHTRDIGELKENGFTSEDGDAIIPVDLITNRLKEEVLTIQNLLDYVNVESVTTASGSYPVLNKTRATMATVEELEKNPALGKLDFNDVDYKVKTYRGQLPISQEAIDDSAVDLASLVATYIANVTVNTINKEIADVMKDFEKAEISSLDDIKELINVKIDAGYDIGFYLSQSLFNAIDCLKNEDGNYYVQPNVTDSSKRTLFGRPITIIRDDIIGEKAGDLVGFVGDAKAGITYFDRKKYTARNIEDAVYGQVLMGAFRGDTKKADGKAGYYMEYKAPSKTALANPTPGMIVIDNK